MPACAKCGHSLPDDASVCALCGTPRPGQEPTAAAGTCNVCGAPVRSGVLFADQELTIVFTDNDEERFIEVSACSRCGNVQMVVDYLTDIEG